MHRVRLLRLLLKLPTGFSLLATLGFGMMAATTVTNGPLHWDFGRIPLSLWPAKPVASARPAEQIASSTVFDAGGLDEWLGLPAPGFFGAFGNDFTPVPGPTREPPPRSGLAGVGDARPQPAGEDPTDDSPVGPSDASQDSTPTVPTPIDGAAPFPAILLTAGGAGPLLAVFPVAWDVIPSASPLRPAAIVPPPLGPFDDGPGAVAEDIPPASDLAPPVLPALPDTPPGPVQTSPETVGSVPEPRGIGLFALALFCLLALVKRHRSDRT